MTPEQEKAWEALCVKPNDIIEHSVAGFGFKLRVVPWTTIEHLRSDATIIDKKSGNTNFQQDLYQESLLNAIIDSGPFEPNNKERFIKAIKTDTRDSILKRINALHMLPEADAKNSKGQPEASPTPDQ